MSLERVSAGPKLPDEFNVIIEIPMNANPVKYEVDKDSGAVAVIRARAIGVLHMDDEAGGDAKLLAVPIDKIYPPYRDIKKPEDLPSEELARIQHFFEHYKDLENGKWVKVKGWDGVDAAMKEIRDSVDRYAKQSD